MVNDIKVPSKSMCVSEKDGENGRDVLSKSKCGGQVENSSRRLVLTWGYLNLPVPENPPSLLFCKAF